MTPTTRKRFVLPAALTAIAFLSVLCHADTPKKSAKTAASGVSDKPAKAALAKPSLDKWWEKSSLDFDKIPTQFLFHGVATASYMNAQGNTQGSMFNGSIDLTARKERYTNHFLAQHRKQDMTYGFGGGSVNLTESTFKDYLDYDLTRHTLALAGIEDYHNSFLFIDRRVTYYGGFGSTLVETKQHLLNVIGGLGYADFKFDQGAMMRVNPAAVAGLPTMSPSSGGALATETWRWAFSPRLTVLQDATYMKYFNSVLGHRWDFGVNLNVPLAKYVSLVPSYRIRDEVNEYTNALRVKPQDRTLSIGLSASF